MSAAIYSTFFNACGEKGSQRNRRYSYMKYKDPRSRNLVQVPK